MSSKKETVKEINCKVVGDSRVGKSSLLLTYMRKRFPTDAELLQARRSCPGLESVTVKDESWTVELFDTSTNKDLANLRLLGYGDKQVILVCFSVVLPSSVESLKNLWLPEITSHCPYVPYILVGTQTDLRDDEITVEKLAQNDLKPTTIEEGKKLATELKAVKYIECSVLTQEGLQDLMKEVVQAAYPRTKESKRKNKCLIL